MHISRTKELSRRAFMTRGAQLAGLGAAAPLAMNLAGFGEAAAAEAEDYKALVCVFLYSGNDQTNTVIPYDIANYDLYSAIRGGGGGRTRGGIALGRDELTATALTPVRAQTLTDDLQYALAPELTGLSSLFAAGKMAVQLNVGPLIAPLSAAQYNGGNRAAYPVPPQLFSHNDQQSFWQSLAIEGAIQGWGGRMGDLALSSNGTSSLTCVTASGNAVYLSGKTASQYQLDASGAISILGLNNRYFGSNATVAALQTLLSQPSSHALENEYTRVTQRSIDMQGTVGAALNGLDLTTNFNPTGVANPLTDQLKIVARMIAARNRLGMKRQVFFVSLNGFDSHDNLMRDHPVLMTKVNEAMTAFYNATVEMGVANNVTAFTASDFGRTLTSNGDGSDHGWGGHHFVVGGAVKGGQFYGTAPHVSVKSDDQVGQGRLLPSTSVDQFAATLARWFGVSAGDMPTVLPRIGNFATADLGFMG